MKKAVSIFLFTSVLSLLIGCGNNSASTPTPTEKIAVTNLTVAATTPRPTWEPTVTNLTAAALGQWLHGKEIVFVTFSTSSIEIDLDNLKVKDDKLHAWLTSRGDYANDMDNNSSFLCRFSRTSNPDAKTENVQVWITMQTTSNNVRRLLSLLADLQSLDVNLDTAEAQVISYIGDVGTRRKAREMIPELLDSLVKALNQSSGRWAIDSQHEDKYGQNPLFYVKELNDGSHISIREITLTSDRVMYNRPFDVELVLPYLGLQLDGFINREYDFTRETIERILLQPLMGMDDEPRLGLWIRKF